MDGQITNYKPKVPHSINDLRLAKGLNSRRRKSSTVALTDCGTVLTPSPVTPLTSSSPPAPPPPPQQGPGPLHNFTPQRPPPPTPQRRPSPFWREMLTGCSRGRLCLSIHPEARCWSPVFTNIIIIMLCASLHQVLHNQLHPQKTQGPQDLMTTDLSPWHLW